MSSQYKYDHFQLREKNNNQKAKTTKKTPNKKNNPRTNQTKKNETLEQPFFFLQVLPTEDRLEIVVDE